MWVYSREGINVNPFTGIYSASKHAVEAIAETMSAELQEFGIEVATINPEPFLTGCYPKEAVRQRRDGHSSVSAGFSEDVTGGLGSQGVSVGSNAGTNWTAVAIMVRKAWSVGLVGALGSHARRSDGILGTSERKRNREII